MFNLIDWFSLRRVLNWRIVGFWLALIVFPSSQFAPDYCTREGFMLVHEEEKYFFLHKHFLLCSNDKDIPTLKTMATYLYCFCIVSWKTPKDTEDTEDTESGSSLWTLFLLAKRNGYPTFPGRPFWMGEFL